ncbi:hypothetical protein MADMEL_59 [Erwinia phage vB_EamM_MadMel]|uniref:Uncharacterized protein n=3 Tax=Agricanvirus TaxID=1984776 RepID=A0A191ZBV8_9CAUD|nr:hypothetical protein FDI00_gp060 [Erwinia phage vB_EamM_Special G]ANJ64870.1 hypothetical protein SPECIALG_60 [Erwinia phage vB_EamM_Special G]AUG85847.1 hypothetical protein BOSOLAPHORUS_59 [Erwinia phage vB_EamM_Bosolaphorus]AUG86487.1 hypothetical protein MADMEL_59 [Erwinia phage vB_EamM_MadMel]
MNNFINDALDIIELNESSARTELCRKQEASLPAYILKLATRLAKKIAYAVSLMERRDEGYVRLGTYSDRWLLCFGDRISRYGMHTSGKHALYLTLDWATFIRDHKLFDVANHLLQLALGKLLPGHCVLLGGETPKHEFEFVICKQTTK